MEEKIMQEICKDMNWYKKIVVHIFKKEFIYAWHCGRIVVVNNRLKDNT
jgi:hypothetical protein